MRAVDRMEQFFIFSSIRRDVKFGLSFFFLECRPTVDVFQVSSLDTGR